MAKRVEDLHNRLNEGLECAGRANGLFAPHINQQFLCSAIPGPSGFIGPATPLVQMISDIQTYVPPNLMPMRP